METTRTQIEKWAEEHNCSRSIAQAILEHASDEKDAFTIWMGIVTQAEEMRIIRRALALTPEDETIMYWGVETIKR